MKKVFNYIFGDRSVDRDIYRWLRDKGFLDEHDNVKKDFSLIIEIVEEE